MKKVPDWQPYFQLENCVNVNLSKRFLKIDQILTFILKVYEMTSITSVTF